MIYVKNVVEKPLYCYYGHYDHDDDESLIDLYSEDLRNAKVGDCWNTKDEYYNENYCETWNITVMVVYKDDIGVLLRQSNKRDYYEEEKTEELIWIELHK